MDATSKDQALGFLKELEKTLNSGLPGPTTMESWIRSTVAEAKTNDKKKHLRLPEAAFLNGQALPALFDFLIHRGLSKEEAKRALLNEYHRTMSDLSSRSPIRWERHPFRKIMSGSPSDIYRGWTNPDKGYGLTRSCPDFSLREPFPHSILFEGKYFPRGSLEFAQRQLVTDIYQTIFYRGLPCLAAAKKHPDWNYDYACLMAYDASTLGTLSSAWRELPQQTRDSFWEGANVYVMILRPGDSQRIKSLETFNTPADISRPP
ncbi:MAG TPA: hypothetical protein VMZ25_11130 [Terriglobales bacterium]|nr:hypothetical protein [Terriglobales bacterium]